ncbi:FadR/GntR family transcriptional regulator [Alsobacter sp. SYSU BS001988]
MLDAFVAHQRPSPSKTPHDVAAKIQQQIVDGTLRPGDRLPAQRGLSETMGVSRASLREALSVLETLGLIDIRPGLGVFVAHPASGGPRGRSLDAGSARDVYEARLALEGSAAALAAERIGQEQLAHVAALVEDMTEAMRRSDLVAMAACDSAFHDAIMEAARNPLLASMYRSARAAMEETQRAPMAGRATLAETVSEHRAIVMALASGDPAGAMAAMRRHIAGSARRLGVALSI